MRKLRFSYLAFLIHLLRYGYLIDPRMSIPTMDWYIQYTNNFYYDKGNLQCTNHGLVQ